MWGANSISLVSASNVTTARVSAAVICNKEKSPTASIILVRKSIARAVDVGRVALLLDVVGIGNADAHAVIVVAVKTVATTAFT